MTNRPTQKKPVLTDWHRVDIVAAVHKKGLSLRRLSIQCGYSHPNSLSVALQKRWPEAEAHIAKAIGTTPEEIWPTRYARLAEKHGIHRTT